VAKKKALGVVVFWFFPLAHLPLKDYLSGKKKALGVGVFWFFPLAHLPLKDYSGCLGC